jgi:hypothetical protein
VDERLRDAQEAAGRIKDISLSKIEKMSRSPETVTRLIAAVLLHREAERAGTIGSIVPVAKRLMSDGACRWQACIAIADGIRNEPELVWQFITEFGSSGDADVRMAVATVLLEHFLTAHFADYFSVVREHALAGDLLFLKTLSSCWFNQNPECERRVKNLLRTARRGHQSG